MCFKLQNMPDVTVALAAQNTMNIPIEWRDLWKLKWKEREKHKWKAL